MKSLLTSKELEDARKVVASVREAVAKADELSDGDPRKNPDVLKGASLAFFLEADRVVATALLVKVLCYAAELEARLEETKQSVTAA